MTNQFSFDRTEDTEESESDLSYSVDSPLINLNDSHFKKRTIMRTTSDEDSYSINLRFKV